MKTDLTSCGFLFNDEGKILLIYHPFYEMWIGVGGHIDENETPDSQLKKEISEELGIDAKILGVIDDIKIVDNTVRNCPVPFHADLHIAKDHYHYAQYYICQPTNRDFELKLDPNEVKECKWFTEKEVQSDKRIENKTKFIVNKAFKAYKKLVK